MRRRNIAKLIVFGLIVYLTIAAFGRIGTPIDETHENQRARPGPVVKRSNVKSIDSNDYQIQVKNEIVESKKRKTPPIK